MQINLRGCLLCAGAAFPGSGTHFFYSPLQSHKVHVKIILDQTGLQCADIRSPRDIDRAVCLSRCRLFESQMLICSLYSQSKKKKVSRLIQLKSVLRAMQARRKPNAYNIVIIVSFLKKRKLLSISLSPACLSLENKKPALKEEEKK